VKETAKHCTTSFNRTISTSIRESTNHPLAHESNSVRPILVIGE